MEKKSSERSTHVTLPMLMALGAVGALVLLRYKYRKKKLNSDSAQRSKSPLDLTSGVMMDAVTFESKGVVKCRKIPKPILLHPTDVIVKILVSGLCGSDLHVYHEREKGIDVGTAMGHEFSGVIEQVGAAVRGFRVGDRVCSPFTCNCGNCFFCLHALPNRCTSSELFGWISQGKGLHGGQAQYVRVPMADSTLMMIPQNITLEEALLSGDNLSTGYYCALQADLIGFTETKWSRTAVRSDQAVETEEAFVVIGCGPVGLMTIIAARFLLDQTGDSSACSHRLFAVDSVPERQKIAAKLGADMVFDVHNALDLIREKTNGRGCAAVMEVVGSPEALKLAYNLVRPGGIISSVGVHTAPNFPFSPVDAYDKNITLKMGRCPARHMMHTVLPLLQRRVFGDKVTSLITHKYPLIDCQDAYKLFDQKREGCLKLLFYPFGQNPET